MSESSRSDLLRQAVLLGDHPNYRLLRTSRYLLAELKQKHACLMGTFYQAGMGEHVRFLVNHQSCEGAGHSARMDEIVHQGQESYHAMVCAELGLPVHETALMGTAANMQYAACAREAHEGLEVEAIATAGVQGNGGRAGDPASFMEHRDEINREWVRPGTINIMVLVNQPMAGTALMRAVTTITEAKTAALQELAVPSRHSAGLATGTGTDQLLLAARVDAGMPAMVWAGQHTKLGELLGKSVLRAVKEALLWQNGLEPSRTRNLFYILERHGIKPALLDEHMKHILDAQHFDFYSKNKMAITHEPQLAACAYSLATLLDRTAYGTFPADMVDELLVNHCALLGAVMAAQPARYHEIRAQLVAGETSFVPLFCNALAAGWKLKWP